MTTVRLMIGPDAEHLEPYESFVPTAEGTFIRSFEGDFDTTYVYRFESQNACDGQTWTSQSDLGSFTILDRTTYYFRAATQGRWDDSANWYYYGTPDCVGYPVAGSEVIVTHPEESQATGNELSKIEVTGDYALKNLTIDGFSDLAKPGYTAWLFAAPSAPKKMLSFEQGLSLARASNCKVIFDHLDFAGRNNTIYTSANCDIVLTNGTTLGANSFPLVENGCSLHLTPGSSLVLTNLSIGGMGTRVTLDNAQVRVAENLLFGGSNGGGELVIRGAASQVVFGNGFSPGRLHEESSRLIFDIPEGGYSRIPVVSYRTGAMEMLHWWYDGTTPFVIDVDPKSRAARGTTGDYQLIDCPSTIFKDKATLGTLPNPDTDYFYWLPADAEKPTQLWVHIRGATGMKILIR